MFSVKSLPVIVIGATLMLGFGQSAEAFPIYASDSSGQIGTVDYDTGEFSSILQGDTAFTDIAVTEDGNLFGSSFYGLYSIDTNTGSSSLIGNYGNFGMNALGFTDSNVLYGARYTGGFYQIDANTGNASLLEGTSTFRSSGDIVFDAAKNLFWGTSMSNKLVTLGLDGSFNEIGDIGFSAVYGLFFNEGTLYGQTAAGQQITLDMETGKGTFDKQITGDNSQIWGSASLPSTGGAVSDVQSVPEPASIMGLLGLATVGVLSQRKRQNAANV